MTHRETPDQKRAKFAWERVSQRANGFPASFSQYANLAKGAPALILSNGLMQALAYIQTRKEDEKKALAEDLCLRLKEVMGLKSSKFADVMGALQSMEAAEYMRATDETMQALRWIRQFVSVFKTGHEGSSSDRQGGQ